MDNSELFLHHPKRRKQLVGLIGGIGSGKSLVGRMLAQDGGLVIEADKLGHEALREPALREQVFRRWPQVRNAAGAVDRRKLGAIVFAAASERRALEMLVFPWIERRIQEEVAQAERNPNVRLIVLDAAIMVEAGWDRFCDVILFVDAPRDVRLQRLQAQRGWSPTEVEARENAQLSLEAKKARADFVLDNSGAPAQTSARVEQLFERLRSPLP